MKTKKKKVLLSVVCLLLVVVVVGSVFLYRCLRPDITLARTVKESEEYHLEQIMQITSESFIPSSTEDKLMELHIWNNSIDVDIYENYEAPLNITVAGEVKDGKTTFWYDGYATTHEGATVSYRKEKTFDFVLDPDSELFQ